MCSTGEFLSLAAMDTFLRSVQPEVNDLFVLSLVLINLLAWMDLFITQVMSCFLISYFADKKTLDGSVIDLLHFYKLRCLKYSIISLLLLVLQLHHVAYT